MRAGAVPLAVARGLAVAMVLALGAPAPVAAAQQPGLVERHLSPPRYDWPVPGPPVAAFAAPPAPWAAGHRGVDLPVRPGREVHPMAAGMVTWSGVVAGDAWVSVAHVDGVVTSYGPLQGAGAALGTPIGPADVIGRARGDAHGRPGRLHVGARRQGRYVDPAGLLATAPPMVATLVGPGVVRVAAPATPAGHAALVPGTPPSPNHLVVLAGLTSATGDQPFRLADLGYGDGTWEQYSYLGVGSDGEAVPYDHRATWGRVHDMALALQHQLRAHAADHPGQAVDLLGHSLGGLVGMYYLLVLHDPTDPDLPPIGRVVTVASPLGGADSADAVLLARDSPVGRALLDLVEAHRLSPPGGDGPLVHDRIPVLDDLGTGSEVVAAVAAAWRRHLADPWSSPLATGTDVLTIGTTLDPVVNEHRSALPGVAHEAVFDIDVVDAHGLVTTNDRTEDLVAAHLAGEPLPDGGLGADLVNATAGVGSALVAAVELAIASGLAALR